MSNFLKALPALATDAGAELFGCTWHGGEGAQWATLSGELDASTAPQLERALCKAELGAELVVIDMRDLAFMDCAGMGVIVDASERLAEAGRRLVVLRGPRAVDLVFTLTGTAQAMNIVDLQPESAHVLGQRPTTEERLALASQR